jgi:hypothetical protein
LKVLDLRRLAVLAGTKDPLLQPAYATLGRRPVDAGPALKSAASRRRFGADHRLTSRQVRQGRGIAFGDTRRKSAPFRDGYCPIRPITGRPSLSPASSTPSAKTGPTVRPTSPFGCGLSLFGRFGVTSPASLHVLQPSTSPLAVLRLEAGSAPTLFPKLHTLGHPAACPGRGT